MLRCSQFGSTASNISGYTISWLIGQRPTGKKCTFNHGKNQPMFAEACLLVIDEYSLADRNCLMQLDACFRKAKGNDLFFGGVDILFVGDCFQMGPVGSTMIHEMDRAEKTKYLRDEFLKSFDTVIILTEQMRYGGSTLLIDLARAIRKNVFEARHVEFLNQRVKRVEDVDFTKSVVIVATRNEKRMFLREFYRQMGLKNGELCTAWRAVVSPVGRTHQRIAPENGLHDICEKLNDAVFEAESTSKSSYSKFLEGFSMYREGELVCCKSNLRVDANIANGTFGKINKFIFPEGTTYNIEEHNGIKYRIASEPPVCIVIETMSDGVDFQHYGTKLRPIWRTTTATTIQYNGTKTRFTVENIPITSAVCATAHAMQGKTIPEEYNVVLTNFRKYWHSFPAPGFYVALTRCVNENQLILLGEGFTLRKLKSYGPSMNTSNEYGRLWRLFENTIHRLDPQAIVPARLDGPQRERANIMEPVGLENDKNACWLNVCIQLLSCMASSSSSSTTTSSAKISKDERVSKLQQSLAKLLKSMKDTTSCFLPSAEIVDVKQLSGLINFADQDVGCFLNKNRDIFQGRSDFSINGTGKCPQCQATTSRVRYTDQLLFLSATQNDTSLETLLQSFSIPSKCKNKSCNAENIHIENVQFTIGEYVVILIRRGINDEKIQSNVTFPLQWQPGNSATKMNLRCVIEHIGDTVHTGHYVAWMNRRDKINRFYRVNDKFVSTATLFEGAKYSPNVADVEASVLLYETVKNN